MPTVDGRLGDADNSESATARAKWFREAGNVDILARASWEMLMTLEELTGKQCLATRALIRKVSPGAPTLGQEDGV